MVVAKGTEERAIGFEGEGFIDHAGGGGDDADGRNGGGFSSGFVDVDEGFVSDATDRIRAVCEAGEIGFGGEGNAHAEMGEGGFEIDVVLEFEAGNFDDTLLVFKLIHPRIPVFGVQTSRELGDSCSGFGEEDVKAEATFSVGETHGLELLCFEVAVATPLGHHRDGLCSGRGIEGLGFGLGFVKGTSPVAFEVGRIHQEQALIPGQPIDDGFDFAAGIAFDPVIHHVNRLWIFEI